MYENHGQYPEINQKMLTPSAGLASAGSVAQPRKQTTADGLVTDMRQMAQRSEHSAERVMGMLQRLGVPQPPSSAHKTSGDAPGGIFSDISAQANRIRAAQTDLENFLTELEQHI